MPKQPNAHLWLVESLTDDPTFLGKKMFGCEAIYLHGLLSLVLADSAEPWNGLLVPTERQNHNALIKKYPSLSPHPVLGKWLYVSAENDNFEKQAAALVSEINEGSQLIGVLPSPRPKSKKKKTRKK